MRRQKVMVVVAQILVVVFALSVFSASTSTTASAHESHDGTHVHPGDKVELPRGSVAWEYEDFANWLSSARLSKSDRLKLESLRKADHPAPLVFTSTSDYQDWIDSLDPEVANMVSNIAVRVKGSNLPTTIDVSESQDGISLMATAGEEEYIIVPMVLTFCAVCGFLVTALIGWALGKWVFDPAYDWLRLQWEELTKCPANHVIERLTDTEYGQCPYQPWCLGTWQRVISSDGISANCECECGANWTAYNPLY